MRRHTENRNQRGMSLVEMLLSLLLLSFVVLGSISLLTISSRQNKIARFRSLATSLSAERLDHLSSTRYRSAANFAQYLLPEETGAAGPPITLSADYGEIPGFPEFRRTVTLNYDQPEAGLVTARVEVFWQDQQQGEKGHSLLTFLHPDLEQN